MDTVHSGFSHEHQPNLITNRNQRKATSVEQPQSFTSLTRKLELKFLIMVKVFIHNYP